MPDRKILFLDVDYVLNTTKTKRMTASGTTFVEPALVRRVRRILNQTGAHAVLTSDWRLDRDDPRYNADYVELEFELRKYGVEIEDVTPVDIKNHRGREIDAWLRANPDVKIFAILDDRGDVQPHDAHLVRTVPRLGLTEEDADRAVEILNRDDPD